MCHQGHNSNSHAINVKLKDTDRWVIGELGRQACEEGTSIRYSNWTFLQLKKISLARAETLACVTAVLFLFSFSAVLTGCSNSMLPSSASSAASGLTSLSPTTTTGTNTVFNLNQVVLSASNPSANFDLIGDGTGAIGQTCTAAATSTSSDPTQPSTCVCNFAYIDANGNNQSIQSPSIYRETDLLRCSFTLIPSGVAYTDVSIFVSTSNSYSSTQRFQFSGTLSGLSLANSTSFQSIQRYQCKDTIVVPGVFSSSSSAFYDPIQSEDPFLSYPLNFYTGNMGGALASFIANPLTMPTSGGAGWNCPTIPNDPSSGLDLTVYSVDRDGGSNTIYPTSVTSDRSTFYLARQPTGAFSIPINSFIAPATITGSGTPKLPPIGYGAAPIPLSNGTETCPDSSVTIPAGYKWVKVWLFRASLEARVYRTSTKISNSGKVACNPGTWTGAATTSAAFTADDVFPDCALSANILGSSDALADRVFLGLASTVNSLGNGACLKPVNSTATSIMAGGTSDPTGTVYSNANYGSIPSNPLFALGSDTYTINQVVVGANPLARPAPNNCTNAPDQLGVCGGLGAGNSAYPASDNNLSLNDTLDHGVSRYDFLFVVSPTSVNALDFKNATPVSLKYTPYRFYSPNDCISGDPDNPASATDCLSNKMIHYGVKFADMIFNGDAQAGRLPAFPVCALQQGP